MGIGEDIVKAELSYGSGYCDGYHGRRPKEKWNEQYMEGWDEGRDDWWREEGDDYE